MECRRREALSESQPERNDPPPSRRRKHAAHGGTLRMRARDERAIYGVERASLRGGQGRRAARGTQQTARWSRRTGSAELLLALAEGIPVVAYLLLNRRHMPG